MQEWNHPSCPLFRECSRVGLVSRVQSLVWYTNSHPFAGKKSPTCPVLFWLHWELYCFECTVLYCFRCTGKQQTVRTAPLQSWVTHLQQLTYPLYQQLILRKKENTSSALLATSAQPSTTSGPDPCLVFTHRQSVTAVLAYYYYYYWHTSRMLPFRTQTKSTTHSTPNQNFQKNQKLLQFSRTWLWRHRQQWSRNPCFGHSAQQQMHRPTRPDHLSNNSNN